MLMISCNVTIQGIYVQLQVYYILMCLNTHKTCTAILYIFFLLDLYTILKNMTIYVHVLIATVIE